MARYDKYDGVTGGTRARLAADLPFDGQGRFGPKAMSLDANGRTVVGTGGAGGFVGVVVKNVPLTPNLGNIAGQVNAGVPIGGKAGQVVDVMKHGDIIFDPDEVTALGITAGTKYYAAANGDLTTVANANYIGHTVEVDRLVVNTAF